jgi:hypothetical protein
MQARAGLITDVEVNGPMPTGAPMSLGELLHPKAPATWALIWFLVAVLFLFIL